MRRPVRALIGYDGVLAIAGDSETPLHLTCSARLERYLPIATSSSAVLSARR
ncbi:MAG: hypothetical protein NZ874_06570 [Fimbriimonadales bacterium]|nr:hypothetical protein [Fimbriimonadales bacterium]